MYDGGAIITFSGDSTVHVEGCSVSYRSRTAWRAVLHVKPRERVLAAAFREAAVARLLGEDLTARNLPVLADTGAMACGSGLSREDLRRLAEDFVDELLL